MPTPVPARRRTDPHEYLGGWRLVRALQVFDDGEQRDEFGLPADGYLVYTPDGVVTAVLGSMTRPSFAGTDPAAGTAAEYGSARRLIAYAGRWTYDPDTSEMTHHVDVSLFPNWQGDAQVRHVALADGQLAVSASPRTDAHGRRFHVELRWERAGLSRPV